jgi:hypothetical protein
VHLTGSHLHANVDISILVAVLNSSRLHGPAPLGERVMPPPRANIASIVFMPTSGTKVGPNIARKHGLELRGGWALYEGPIRRTGERGE